MAFIGEIERAYRGMTGRVLRRAQDAVPDLSPTGASGAKNLLADSPHGMAGVGWCGGEAGSSVVAGGILYRVCGREALDQ